MNRGVTIAIVIAGLLVFCGLLFLGTAVFLTFTRTGQLFVSGGAPTTATTRTNGGNVVNTPVRPGVQPTAPSGSTTGRNQPTGQGQYKQSTMDQFVYTWSYVPALPSVTTGPKLRDDAQSSGKGVTTTHDIGVPPGTFAIVKGVSINVGGVQLGTPCALAALSPGYYRNVLGTEWRWEVYYLPNSSPLDPTGWSKVLADQAQVTEHTLYGCPSKSLSGIPVFYSSEPTPFGP